MLLSDFGFALSLNQTTCFDQRALDVVFHGLSLLSEFMSSEKGQDKLDFC